MAHASVNTQPPQRSLTSRHRDAMRKPNPLGTFHWMVVCIFAFLHLDKICAEGITPALVATGSSSLDSRAACALSLTRSHLSDTTHISVLGDASWLDDFLEAIDVPVTLLQPGDGRMCIHNRQYDVVFLVFDEAGNHNIVKDALGMVRKTNKRHSTRVVVWWRTGDVHATVQAARDLDLVRMVWVNTSSSYQQILAYREDCEGGLGVARAVPVGTCTETGLLHVHEDPFLHPLCWNLRGCMLQVGTVHSPPAVILKPGPGGSYKVSGILGPLVKMLAERVNATINVSVPSDGQEFGWGFPNGTAWGVQGDVMHKRRDIGITDFFQSDGRYAVVELSPGYKSVCYTPTVPAGIGPKHSSWYLVFRMFSPGVWMCVGISYFMVLAAWCFPWTGPGAPFADNVALFMMCTLLGSSYGTVSLPTSRVKILAASWMLLTIVLGTAYNAVRQSLMAAPSPKAEIETLHQIEKQGLNFIGYSSTHNYLRIFAYAEGNATLIKFATNWEDAINFGAAVKRVVTERNVAVFEDPESVLYYAAPMEVHSGRRLVHVLRSCIYTSNISPFMLRHGSPLIAPAHNLISRAFECGLTHYWQRKSRFGQRRLHPNRGWQKLKLYKLGSVFKLFLFGLASGAAVFGLELLTRKTRP